MYGVLKLYCEDDSVSIPTSKLPNALLGLGLDFSEHEVRKLRSRALVGRPRGSRGHVNVMDLLELLVPRKSKAKVVRARTIGSKRRLKRRRRGASSGGSGRDDDDDDDDDGDGDNDDDDDDDDDDGDGDNDDDDGGGDGDGDNAASTPARSSEAPTILQAWGDKPELPPSPNGVKCSAFAVEQKVEPLAKEMAGSKPRKTKIKKKKKKKKMAKTKTKAKKKGTKKRVKKKRKTKKGRKIIPLDVPLYDLGIEAIKKRDADYEEQLEMKEREAIELAEACKAYRIERKWPSAVERLKSGLPPAEIMYSWADGKRLRGVETSFSLCSPHKIGSNGAFYEKQCRRRQRTVDEVSKKRKEKEDAERELRADTGRGTHVKLIETVVT